MGQQDLILGIETSCDDTSVALVAQDGTIAACETFNQFEIHAGYGGVFPELASRAHVQAILPAVDKVMAAVDHDRSRIKAIGVTRGPGLIGSLLVGVNAGQALGFAWDKPVYGINHLRGHLRSPDLEEKRIEYPAVMLLVSGGHTLLAYLANQSDVTLLGTTRDDSAGESYDKVARMIGLGMPGGPAIDKLAKTGKSVFDFPRPMMHQGYEFSFSGLKSSVARLLEKEPDCAKEDIATSFVDACLDVLEKKLRRAVDEYQPKSLVVVGGVSASPQLRAQVDAICTETGVKSCLPPLKWATDNAAMIALAAWDYVAKDLEPDTVPTPSLAVSAW
ncbi:tRNA (adenosine(37)-N6)-threonylcarbamoyltransferase complex transferase subunit TsaD [Roseibium denhamense]|uniref:tRNA N6-adenosine threonylcarbamoyltransferase n=1 Tax=Roseibium denhamense TaxID=76305 RepID=A0ABY1P5D5_9HYPH|nr:tRNA (adenosine(37)-N6)-threonylcarbamoyltransferase complex transferase subunit TsaD [Roseibium denhamense]MTI07184.1 tRNA (adenosine(37)-N6)-threonylcarbamoyltransferase complex transferase subunit TsaD [Roseibium denhamense]SMP26723.1 O-sialoglycoprotein endopeptidase [Roseibium denhamense]